MGTTETMDCDNKIRVNGLHGKNGRPSYLAQFREFWRSGETIEPLPVAPMNEAGWFELYSGYILRAHSTGENTDKFNVPEPMRHWIRKRLETFTASKKGNANDSQESSDADFSAADRQLARLLGSPKKSNLGLLVPPSRLSASEWVPGRRLGSRLMALARREPSLVQSAVLGYCLAATTRHYVIMTDEQDAVYGRLLIELVKELHISGLKVRLVGFRVGYNLPDIGRWLRILELRATTPVDFETANNLESMARLNHVGIKVCWDESSRASQEWHEVALLAAITELWRSVTPSHGYELIA
jgi:hypothetical protein